MSDDEEADPADGLQADISRLRDTARHCPSCTCYHIVFTPQPLTPTSADAQLRWGIGYIRERYG